MDDNDSIADLYIDTEADLDVQKYEPLSPMSEDSLQQEQYGEEDVDVDDILVDTGEEMDLKDLEKTMNEMAIHLANASAAEEVEVDSRNAADLSQVRDSSSELDERIMEAEDVKVPDIESEEKHTTESTEVLRIVEVVSKSQDIQAEDSKEESFDMNNLVDSLLPEMLKPKRVSSPDASNIKAQPASVRRFEPDRTADQIQKTVVTEEGKGIEMKTVMTKASNDNNEVKAEPKLLQISAKVEPPRSLRNPILDTNFKKLSSFEEVPEDDNWSNGVDMSVHVEQKQKTRKPSKVIASSLIEDDLLVPVKESALNSLMNFARTFTDNANTTTTHSIFAHQIKGEEEQDGEREEEEELSDISEYEFYSYDSLNEDESQELISDYEYYSYSEEEEIAIRTPPSINAANKEEEVLLEAAEEPWKVSMVKIGNPSKAPMSQKDRLKNDEANLTRKYSRRSRRIDAVKPEASNKPAEARNTEEVPFEVPLFGQITHQDKKIQRMKSMYRLDEKASPLVLRKDHRRPYNHMHRPETDQDDDFEITRRSQIPDDQRSMLDGPKSRRLKMTEEEREKRALKKKRIRKQLRKITIHRPVFTYTIIILNIAASIIQFAHSWYTTGIVIQTNPLNIMLGPPPKALVRQGARYVPCMKSTGQEFIPWNCSFFNGETSRTLVNFTQARIDVESAAIVSDALLGSYESSTRYWEPQAMNASSINSTTVTRANTSLTPTPTRTTITSQAPTPTPTPPIREILIPYGMCTLEQYCGLLNFEKAFKPDQFYRFVSAIFLHTGLIHLGINCYMMLQTGVPMETAYGWTRIAIIYFLSGIGGFIFGANVISQVPSVGASGAIFGIHGCVLLDLLLHFELVKNRWKELGKLLGLSFISLVMGLLPYIDNFAHIGGFIIGILSGLVLFPSISFSKEDQNRKLLARIFALPILIGIFAGLIVWFYSSGQQSCSWCKYLDCIPLNGWCDGYD